MPSESLAAFLLYCRAGFENECAQEITAYTTSASISGYARAEKNSGFVEFFLQNEATASAPPCVPIWSNLIFARQALYAFAHLEALPTHDRLTAIMGALLNHGQCYNEVWVEAPDNPEGKQLANFCRKFSGAFVSALKKAKLLTPSASLRLHLFFPQSNKAILAETDPALAAPWPQGIPRLKFPSAAPSRSTLKLDEAFQVLLSASEREQWLKPGMTAVDLGAAPGGWTWQLVRRSIHVTAVDNGPMARELIDSGLVDHLRADGFTYRPKRPVDWVVCDMVEQPRRVAELISHWLVQGWCRFAIFNLKLPMKKRYSEVELCLSSIQRTCNKQNKSIELRAKQLYHDREEITALAYRC